MTHFGILCLAATGHLNTMLPLGRELQRRGHQVTVFSDLRAQAKASEAGLGYKAISSETLERSAQLDREEGDLTGLRALRRSINSFKKKVSVSLRDAPTAIQAVGAEALLVDASVFEGGTIAEALNLPFVTVCSALAYYQEADIPPVLTAWSYNPNWQSRLRNRAAHKLFNLMAQPVWRVISQYRQAWNLPTYSNYNDIFSKLVIVSQHLAEFEFPRQLPPHFHYVGPFHDSTGRPDLNFPWSKLRDVPLIYASLGTKRNRLIPIFQAIAAACVDLNAQLVISLGGGTTLEAVPDLPGNPLVVEYAPQLKILKQTNLCLTHAGLNTTLESLSNGVPLVAIPLADEQPGVAARIAWTGTGEFLLPSRLSVSKLRAAIKKVLAEDSYKQHAIRLQEAVCRSGGVRRAADLIEQAVLTRKPVVNE